MKLLMFMASCALLSDAGASHAAPRSGAPPRHRFPKVGTCYVTRISAVEGRLVGVRVDGWSGSQVEFENGVFQVSYGTVPAIVHSRVGDKVTMCVVELPVACPPGDFRGVVYRTHNWRTKQNWTLPNAEHSCGGA